MPKTGKKVRIFSALEVANICGVVNQTAINWIKNGYLKAFTTPGGQYRVYSEDLVEFLHGRGMRMPEELQRVLEQQLSLDSVLIVDDDRDFNNLLKDALSAAKPEFKIHQAFDGFEAGQVNAEINPSVVILDINLPGVDGVKLCRRFKENRAVAPPVIIAVSGQVSEELKAEVLELGADAFLRKPIDLDRLPELIENLAGNR